MSSAAQTPRILSTGNATACSPPTAGLIRAAKTNGSAYWGLMGISFVYGIFHAAGPGHGKAVISSYLLANEETWRRGIVLSFASALLQALTAVVIVAIAAVLIGATAKMMGNTVRVIELVSYALIVLVGGRLLWVKGRGFFHAVHEVGLKPEAAPMAVALEPGARRVDSTARHSIWFRKRRGYRRGYRPDAANWRWHTGGRRQRWSARREKRDASADRTRIVRSRIMVPIVRGYRRKRCVGSDMCLMRGGQRRQPEIVAMHMAKRNGKLRRQREQHQPRPPPTP